MSPLSGGIWQSRRKPSDSYADGEGRGDTPRSPWSVSAKPCPAEGGREGGSEVAQSCLTLQPHGLYPTRLLSPWSFPGKSTGVGCLFLLQQRGLRAKLSHVLLPALFAVSSGMWSEKSFL
ncbi:unnamed protein product [Rangifer tarandus platyrhynchus]|uniref:Uncharacterized protein n=1 Tax=Rangifer tarandus platyrhynchus TaxID=3082113 RepID=A0ABN8YM06_RANTA|nr:unnamed protein product [Rangifer tarandus platyrhynchus]